MKVRVACAAFAAVLLFAPAAEANYIVNGGFETGDLTGWDPSDTLFEFVDTANPHSGFYNAELGSVGSIGTLSQAISDTPGEVQDFVLTYWLASLNSGTPPSIYFAVDWNGVLVPNSTVESFDGKGDYTEYTFYLRSNGTGSDTLSFLEEDDASFLNLDDVSLTVPEPSSVSLFGAALLTLAGFFVYSRRESRS